MVVKRKHCEPNIYAKKLKSGVPRTPVYLSKNGNELLKKYLNHYFVDEKDVSSLYQDILGLDRNTLFQIISKKIVT